MKTVWDNKWDEFKKSERNHSNLDRVSRAIFNFIKLSVKENDKVLETGCGTGRFAFAIAEISPSIHVTGTDISKDSIELSNKSRTKKGLLNTDFKVMDIYSLSFPDNTFDVSFNEGVLQHLPDDMAGLKEMVRVTKPGGLVFASNSNFMNFPHTIYKFLKGKKYELYPERSYTHTKIINMFKQAGLKDIKICGVHPGYGMQRIEGYLPLIGPIIAQLMYLAAFVIDPISRNWYSNQFGFQVTVKGRK